MKRGMILITMAKGPAHSATNGSALLDIDPVMKNARDKVHSYMVEVRRSGLRVLRIRGVIFPTRGILIRCQIVKTPVHIAIRCVHAHSALML